MRVEVQGRRLAQGSLDSEIGRPRDDPADFVHQRQRPGRRQRAEALRQADLSSCPLQREVEHDQAPVADLVVQ